MGEGKVTLTCGHTHETPVGIWEPEIDRHGNRCRSYSTFCPVCAEDASLVMVKRIEELEAEMGRVKVLEDVLREIANGAFNDNGEVTMDHGHMIRAFFKARAALAKAKGEE